MCETIALLLMVHHTAVSTSEVLACLTIQLRACIRPEAAFGSENTQRTFETKRRLRDHIENGAENGRETATNFPAFQPSRTWSLMMSWQTGVRTPAGSVTDALRDMQSNPNHQRRREMTLSPSGEADEEEAVWANLHKSLFTRLHNLIWYLCSQSCLVRSVPPRRAHSAMTQTGITSSRNKLT
ncbi:hypothetical protein N657DRAFT_345612 [Parathielavia appendiculata]|uniref:Secreted protein n=1 Tax=Parathielavia appendiculata TaxID=2587402 RepID=A0AAN6Z4R8_9PEZI|nr:hypothetical protein N657DRAFT_345612 [Parathielavia appendiculata]